MKLALLTAFLPVTSASYGYYNQQNQCRRVMIKPAICSESSFHSASLVSECEEDNQEKITVTGTVSASSFDKNDHVWVVPCYGTTGVDCVAEFAVQIGNACDILESKYGDKCGNSGTYVIEEEIEIPYIAQYNNMMMKFIVGDLEDCEEEWQNTATFSYYYSIFGYSAVITGGAALFWMRRRRMQTEQDEKTVSFVEMNDRTSAMA